MNVNEKHSTVINAVGCFFVTSFVMRTSFKLKLVRQPRSDRGRGLNKFTELFESLYLLLHIPLNDH